MFGSIGMPELIILVIVGLVVTALLRTRQERASFEGSSRFGFEDLKPQLRGPFLERLDLLLAVSV